MKLFLDSSAFAKRFVDEPGSELVQSLCSRADELGLSVLCVPEIVSALNRLQREKRLTPQQYREAKRHLLEDVRDADILHLTDSVVGTALQILEASPVRAMDALHIACAGEWKADLFASADDRQVAAARKMGLTVKQV
jgi:predicted nucleic acid-binding protein